MNFDEVMKRIEEGTGAKSQADLATILEVRRGTISEAKKRNSIPSDWIIKLCRSHSLNPLWLLDGTDPRYLLKGGSRVNTNLLPDFFISSRTLDKLLSYCSYAIFFVETIDEKFSLNINPYTKGLLVDTIIEYAIGGLDTEDISILLSSLISILESQYSQNPTELKAVRTLKEKVKLMSLKEVLDICKDGYFYDEKNVIL